VVRSLIIFSSSDECSSVKSYNVYLNLMIITCLFCTQDSSVAIYLQNYFIVLCLYITCLFVRTYNDQLHVNVKCVSDVAELPLLLVHLFHNMLLQYTHLHTLYRNMHTFIA